jgi:hypothetical protein
VSGEGKAQGERENNSSKSKHRKPCTDRNRHNNRGDYQMKRLFTSSILTIAAASFMVAAPAATKAQNSSTATQTTTKTKTHKKHGKKTNGATTSTETTTK